jgi:proteasome lid subunit RPN8/RPN11
MDATLGDLRPGEAGGRPVPIECSTEVMEGLHAEVSEAFYSVPHGGAETGGVLYGTRDDFSLRIAAARPLPCEHAFGPSFRLSPNDVRRLEALVEAPRRDRSLAGLEAVGWYHSHTRSDLRLSDDDIEMHRRHFPEAWQVALLLRPVPMQPTRIGYFLPDEAGQMSGPHQEGTITTAPAKQTAGPARPRRQPAREPEPAPAPESLEPAHAGLEPEPDIAPLFLPREAHRSRAWIWAVAAVAVCAGALAIWAPWSRPDQPRPDAPARLGLRTTDRAGQMEVQWDPDSAAIRDATSGILEIADGSERQSVLLDAAFLKSGIVTYARHTQVVRFHLLVVRSDGRTAEQYGTLIGNPLPSPPAPAVAEQTAAPRAEPARKSEPPARKAARPAQRSAANSNRGRPAGRPAPPPKDAATLR